MSTRKQVAVWLSTADWLALRAAAARQHIPMTELCRRWLHPHLERLRRQTRVEGLSGVSCGFSQVSTDETTSPELAVEPAGASRDVACQVASPRAPTTPLASRHARRHGRNDVK
uniref:Uncharacterized protein n=1 Tax=Schlesneria paludicola TaxID=360056 RepID=A0A7C4QQC6_9PLAN